MNALDLCYLGHQMYAVCRVFVREQIECMMGQVVLVLDKRQSGRKLGKAGEQSMTTYLRPRVSCLQFYVLFCVCFVR